ncbi:M10 family metallopeptidase [Rhizobium sp. Root482]|uniref:M10 family metallopeptidase n=1 Tax=Rhizobium sp. Root482 TaxID=1736543 RepID=UPI0006FDE99E|nr:M10 family metallopeptidase [Rhizobium sp. Root482]KQY14583.1 protease [Rhizobium sp. Root482]
MTGINKTSKTIFDTTNPLIDGVISGYAWNGTSITYAFPTLTSSYTYTTETSNNFAAISTAQKNAALFAMEQSFGTAANDGFSVEGFTKISFSLGSTTTANLRFAQSDAATPTAYAYYPGSFDAAGDIWFSTQYAGTVNDYRTPVAGNYAWHTLIHELGHALGLKHGHQTDTFGAIPAKYNSVEYTVMTYHSFVGDDGSGYKYEQFGAPQSFMMADIAALQHMYGADYTTNSGNTVYKWTPTSGNTVVDGDIAIAAGANRIFATIWDGGGVDTFDLRAYATAITIDLRPGRYSTFSDDQLAYLGGGGNDGYARGNIFNALLYQGNTQSLIENVRGGSASDKITGNEVSNSLYGYNGNDRLYGLEGDDYLLGGEGNDMVSGNVGKDRVYGGLGADDLYGGADADNFIFSKIGDSTASSTGRDTIFDFSGTAGDRIDLSRIDASTKTAGNQAFSFIGTGVFTGTAGELRYVKAASDTYVYGDVNGDKKIDIAIHLDDAMTLSKGYFIL